MKASEMTDDQLEDCVDGNTSIPLLREIIEKCEQPSGIVNEDAFADWFAYGVEGFIDANLETPEWDEANDGNLEWGYDIAAAINEFVQNTSEQED